MLALAMGINGGIRRKGHRELAVRLQGVGLAAAAPRKVSTEQLPLVFRNNTRSGSPVLCYSGTLGSVACPRFESQGLCFPASLEPALSSLVLQRSYTRTIALHRRFSQSTPVQLPIAPGAQIRMEDDIE